MLAAAQSVPDRGAPTRRIAVQLDVVRDELAAVRPALQRRLGDPTPSSSAPVEVVSADEALLRGSRCHGAPKRHDASPTMLIATTDSERADVSTCIVLGSVSVSSKLGGQAQGRQMIRQRLDPFTLSADEAQRR